MLDAKIHKNVLKVAMYVLSSSSNNNNNKHPFDSFFSKISTFNSLVSPFHAHLLIFSHSISAWSPPDAVADDILPLEEVWISEGVEEARRGWKNRLFSVEILLENIVDKVQN